jgi:hypothetical protein
VEEAERQLARLHQQRDAAAEAVRGAVRRRAALLLEDGSDPDIAAADAEADAQRLMIERLDAAEPVLHRRLGELRDTARAKLRAKLLAEHEATVQPYVEAARLAVAAAMRAQEARNALLAAGFRPEAESLPPPPPFLFDLEKVQRGVSALAVHPSLDQFESQCARAHRHLLAVPA